MLRPKASRLGLTVLRVLLDYREQMVRQDRKVLLAFKAHKEMLVPLVQQERLELMGRMALTVLQGQLEQRGRLGLTAQMEQTERMAQLGLQGQLVQQVLLGQRVPPGLPETLALKAQQGQPETPGILALRGQLGQLDLQEQQVLLDQPEVLMI